MKSVRAQFVIPILASILILGIIPFNDASAVTNDTKLTASDAAAGDQFGNSVSISGDTVIVGAPRNIIWRIIHAFWTTSRQQVDRSQAKLAG